MQKFLSCIFCGTRVKYPEGNNASFYRNHLVAIHNVDHKFPGMNIIVNRTLQLQICSNKSNKKVTVSQKQLYGTKKQGAKNKLSRKTPQSYTSNNLQKSFSISTNLEDDLLHEAALGKLTYFKKIILINNTKI